MAQWECPARGRKGHEFAPHSRQLVVEGERERAISSLAALRGLDLMSS